MTWFDVHDDPFAVGDGKLRSFSTGVAASDGDSVTCNEVEIIGAEPITIHHLR